MALDNPARPILLAVSANGPAMTSTATRHFIAAMAAAQRHGRPYIPADQVWIERLFGHVKQEMATLGH